MDTHAKLGSGMAHTYILAEVGILCDAVHGRGGRSLYGLNWFSSQNGNRGPSGLGWDLQVTPKVLGVGIHQN
ncbi:hypothetical protein D8674_020466 [Pyrus ussuriensis x Pyrus communis]|uniref:Uncharacterized protein n=1 Tax=Pyrus ussuriensis x Pyrus communis TaxID=2448454 RepID=A0A5N5HGT9_9ROSA|nr:hypothetical protein D8674_020466 [Pyrus ussuriensis x Pyrus communis]